MSLAANNKYFGLVYAIIKGKSDILPELYYYPIARRAFCLHTTMLPGQIYMPVCDFIYIYVNINMHLSV